VLVAKPSITLGYSLKWPEIAIYNITREHEMSEVIEQIKQQIETNTVLLYMKSNPNQPQCGFSARTVQALMECGKRFAYVDILTNPEIRASLPAYANWPTFPQLWVKGELVGGCDIITEMAENGELKELIDAAIPDEA